MTTARPLKIGFNALSLRPAARGGGEVYQLSLLHALARVDRRNAYTVFVTPRTLERISSLPANFDLVSCPVPGGRLEVYSRLAWEWTALRVQARHRALDVMHFPGNLVPARFPVPTVLTVHDFSSLFYREQLPEVRLPASTRLLDMERVRSCARADRVVAISTFTSRELLRRTSAAEERVSVVHSAGRELDIPSLAAAREVAARYGVTDAYVLAVATVNYHKNLPRLLEAFSLARDRMHGRKLMLVGRAAKAGGMVRDLIDRLDLGRDVVQAGYVPDEDLPALYRAADLFVLPSLYEGFGLPVLEAASCGTPVVAADAGSLPEIGGDAAVYFDPLRVEDIARALAEVVGSEELRRTMSERGRARAAEFNWDETARQVVAVYERAAA